MIDKSAGNGWDIFVSIEFHDTMILPVIFGFQAKGVAGWFSLDPNICN